MNQEKLIFCGNNADFLDSEKIKQSNSSNGGTAFRIPSLIKAGDTLIATIDKQSCGSDWGFIEIAIRRSDDAGETWSDIETIVSPPAREIIESSDCFSSAFFIDPLMSVAPNGDVILLIDFYPECKGLHNRRILDKKKLPYTMCNGRLRPALYDREGNLYVVGEDKRVLDGFMNPTEYKQTDWFGSLYKNDEYAGNIFLNGSKPKSSDERTTFGAPLKAPKRNYIYMLRSKDNGKTWSEPIDITQDFLIKSDGTFIGTAPGVGLTTHDGKILMPLYVDRKETAVVFSIDNGESWKRMSNQPYCCNVDEWQLVQAPDGVILGIGRQKRYGKSPMSISYDNGIHWCKAKKTKIYAPKCQKSIISIGDYVFCSHASGKARENGVITTGKFTKSGGRTSGIEWYKDTKINSGFFAYSCLAQIDDNYIGVLYEAAPSSYICFKKYKISDLM